jgi:PEP-CTERM motif
VRGQCTSVDTYRRRNRSPESAFPVWSDDRVDLRHNHYAHLHRHLKNWVQADPNNTFCANCLDFIYVFTNLGPAVNQRFSMSSFAGFMTDLGTNPFGVHDPITVSRSLTAGGPVLSFNFDEFGDGIKPGETTVDLIVETNALKYTIGYLSAQDGTAGSGVGFAPAATVPEPTSLMLMGGGLLALGSFLRKSRAR